jgi:5'-nucleotidase
VVKGPEGNEVLVVQAWKWGEELGALTVRFDERGDVAGYDARPRLLVGDTFSRDGAVVPPGSADYRAVVAAVNGSAVARIVPEDPAVLSQLAPYSREIQRYKETAIGAVAVDDLIRGPNSGPGPLMADAMLAKVPTARIAFLGSGGVRRDILKGEITLAAVLGSFPFGNTLVTLDLTGSEIRQALEEGIDFQIAMHPPDSGDWQRLPIIHTAGLTYRINPLRPKGERISDLRLTSSDRSTTPLDPAATYRVVTDSFLAGGHDGMTTMGKTVGYRNDTGFLGTDAFMDYLRSLGRVTSPTEQRIVIDPSRAARPAPTSRLHDTFRRPAYPSGRQQPAVSLG